MTKRGWRRTLASGAALLACGGALAPSPSALAAPPPPPPASKTVIGMPLSGAGTSLVAPTSPTLKPYSGDCHKLLDPAFSGRCIVATSRGGTVAGVVEVERGAFGGQERDLVWRKTGRHWALALLHVSENPGPPTLLWRCVLRPGRQELVFVLPAKVAGFGSELDVVEGNGQVSLYRYLGTGFANVALGTGLVTYVPVGLRSGVRAPSYFDQALIGWLGSSWRVIAQQYVPYSAAMRQHRGEFWDEQAVPAG